MTSLQKSPARALQIVQFPKKKGSAHTCVLPDDFRPTDGWRKNYVTTMQILDNYNFMFEHPHNEILNMNSLKESLPEDAGLILTDTNSYFVSGNELAKNKPLSLEDIEILLSSDVTNKFSVFQSAMQNIREALTNDPTSSEHGGQNQVWARIKSTDNTTFVLKKSLDEHVQRKMKFDANLVAIYAEIMAPYIRFNYNGQYWILMEELQPATSFDDHIQYLSKIVQFNSGQSSQLKLIDKDYHIHQLGKKGTNVLRWDQEGLELENIVSFEETVRSADGKIKFKEKKQVVCESVDAPSALKSLIKFGYKKEDLETIVDLLKPVIEHENKTITRIKSDTKVPPIENFSMYLETLLASSCIVLMLACQLSKRYVYKKTSSNVEFFVESSV